MRPLGVRRLARAVPRDYVEALTGYWFTKGTIRLWTLAAVIAPAPVRPWRMTPEEAAEAHIAEALAMARGVQWGSPGVAFAGRNEYAASVRAQAEAFLRPVDEYVGLALRAAQALASGRGDRLCVHPASGHRANLTSQRVHVLVEDREVMAARLDRPPWLGGVAEEARW